MKAILAAAALVMAGAQADAAVYSFQFVVTSGSTENIDIGTGRFSIDAPSLENLYIYQNARPDEFDTDPKLQPPILSTPFGLHGVDPEGLFFEVSFNSMGKLSWLFIGTSEFNYGNYFTENSVKSWFEEGDGEVSYAAYGYWKEVTPSPVPLPATAPMLLTGAALLCGLRRRLKA